MMRSSLLRVVFVCLKVQGLVVELGPRGERLGVLLVVDSLSMIGNEIILSLLVFDVVWPVGGVVEVWFDWVFCQRFVWLRACLLLGIRHFFVLRILQSLG